MGDGEHVWAAAEWIMMLRNCFVREEGGALIIGSGVRPEWLQHGEPLGIEGTLTPFGELSVWLRALSAVELELTLEGEWRGAPPAIEAGVPGYRVVETRGSTILLQRC